MTSLAERIRSGDVRAVARGISIVENDPVKGRKLLCQMDGAYGRAFRVGITGPPGVGKSTLVGEMARLEVGAGRRVAVIAIDPTSPFTGGALLGDRVRMQQATENTSLFVRSMASRGMPGGVARATWDAADILDASGHDLIFIETVGVGQSEIEVSRLADCTLVALSPESGDSIQAMKSGLMEIADLIVVNKTDRPGADKLIQDITGAFNLRLRKRTVGMFKTSAYNGGGVPELVEGVRAYIAAARRSGEFEKRRRNNLRYRLQAAVEFMIQKSLWDHPGARDRLEARTEEVFNGSRPLYESAELLLRELTEEFFR